MSRDPVFGHVTYFTLQKTLNISRAVRDRNKISNMTIRKSGVINQMAISVLIPCGHVTQFPDIYSVSSTENIGYPGTIYEANTDGGLMYVARLWI